MRNANYRRLEGYSAVIPVEEEDCQDLVPVARGSNLPVSPSGQASVALACDVETWLANRSSREKRLKIDYGGTRNVGNRREKFRVWARVKIS